MLKVGEIPSDLHLQIVTVPGVTANYNNLLLNATPVRKLPSEKVALLF